MHETDEDIAGLQALLDRSMASAGAHLNEIITEERRLTATVVCERLQGMSLLVLATVSSDGRPLCGPVDGIFEWENFLDSGPVYARIDADRMFTFHMETGD